MKKKIIREIIIEKDITDMKGWIIRKGTRLFVMAEMDTRENHRVVVVRVDNGTGLIELMPETAIREVKR